MKNNQSVIDAIAYLIKRVEDDLVWGEVSSKNENSIGSEDMDRFYAKELFSFQDGFLCDKYLITYRTPEDICKITILEEDEHPDKYEPTWVFDFYFREEKEVLQIRVLYNERKIEHYLDVKEGEEIHKYYTLEKVKQYFEEHR